MKISNLLAYPKKLLPLLTDYVIGTDYSTGKKQTKNFQLNDVLTLFLSGLNPSVGGSLKITELEYTGFAVTPEVALNSMPPYIVSDYEFIVLNVNGYKWILKLQGITVGTGNVVTTNTDFIQFPTSVGQTGQNGADGSTWRSGSGIPSNSTGANGDYYLNTANGDVYLKASDTYTVNANIKGATGAAGSSTPTNIIAGQTTSISGNGAVSTPFVIEVKNTQRIITGNITLANTDYDSVIFINNGTTPLTITVPNGLQSDFECGFYQKGTADVTFVGTGGATLYNPIGLKIKGQGYTVFLEKDPVTTNNFVLTGNTKA